MSDRMPLSTAHCRISSVTTNVSSIRAGRFGRLSAGSPKSDGSLMRSLMVWVTEVVPLRYLIWGGLGCHLRQG